MSRRLDRREFLRRSGAAGVAVGAFGMGGCQTLPQPRRMSPNEKLNIAVVGVSGRGAANVDGIKGENVVAICDVDANKLAAAHQQFPLANTYSDYRIMLEQADIDAVVISTPDHNHAPASIGAIQQGYHVYCEKPLTHTVEEARNVTEMAARYGVTTQMGTQIHANDNYRRVVEAIQAGTIGEVNEVHVWVNKAWAGGELPAEGQPVPDHLKWDLWLGPAPERPYHSTYVPANWRRWWAFGGGTLGDMGCHYMDLPFWALDLKYPDSVHATGPDVHPETTPHKLKVDWMFPAYGRRGPVKMTWYDDGLVPPQLKEHGIAAWGSGVLFIGDKGQMIADYNNFKLYPEAQFEGWVAPPQTIENSIGHHAEWIQACKTGAPTTCDFSYSGPLTETVLLGNVAFRAGQKLDWDAKNLIATNAPQAQEFVQKAYREGWKNYR